MLPTIQACDAQTNNDKKVSENVVNVKWTCNPDAN